MFTDNRGYCEKCKKIRSYTLKEHKIVKELNIGRIEVIELSAHCLTCGELIYSEKVREKNSKEVEQAIMNLQEELEILHMLREVKTSDIIKESSDKEILEEIKSILRDKK
ncbi:hypothetical protein [Clostridium chauvoei]|uniref:YgiT-type zinc finger domain protein n=2 Tax=Clostridium chauvoei TaxID=46867 RepID=A0A1U6JE17_9CLOT|nr:hypothetical protein [Clostridium chauvoei]ATD55142.1 hypothetical protein BTM20_07770 [Clostridium chauvoei]ATD57185.1 hypothetical protein BTM21_05285 [Clostridium chauvoei]MBX7279488.1 hypothetical protein [Clostridium chauvoei]MBX7282426.1 hypothetical protein [Clostridium chauvoei]MBX7285687.1 hypothetical protein [Clostridium chauvoei]